MGKDLRLLMVPHARDVRTIHIASDPVGLLAPPAVDEVARQLRLCLQAGDKEGTP